MQTTVVTIYDRKTGLPKKRMSEQEFKAQYPASEPKQSKQVCYKYFHNKKA